MGRKGRGRSKLKVEGVVRIKNLYKTGKHSMRGLSREYGVSLQTIRSVLRGESWLGIGCDVSKMAKRGWDPAKLTEDQVSEIRELLEVGVPLTEIAQRYGVSRRTIYGIREGETWKSRQ